MFFRVVGKQSREIEGWKGSSCWKALNTFRIMCFGCGLPRRRRRRALPQLILFGTGQRRPPGAKDPLNRRHVARNHLERERPRAGGGDFLVLIPNPESIIVAGWKARPALIRRGDF